MIKHNFPNWTTEKLQNKALEHARALALQREDFLWEPPDNIDRLVVNMLRHKYTNYDSNQTIQTHKEACLAIAEKYLWLKEECDRQIRRRQEEEDFMNVLVKAEQAEKEQKQKQRRSTIESSTTIIKTLNVGQEVTIKVQGYQRVGTIKKINRTKVEIEYTLKNGQTRTLLTHAANVTALP